MKSLAARWTAMAGAIAMMGTAPATAAGQTQGPAYSPWSALSAFASQNPSRAL